jgi:short-subunit dehydrogenase
MTLPLQNRTVVLTGAASGIGAALASALAAKGAALALIDIQTAPLELLANTLRAGGTRVQSYALDVTNQAALARLPAAIASDLGPAAVLINNAGIALVGNFDQVTPEQFDRVLAVNFVATVAMTRLFLPQLRANTPAQIVNLSSLFGIVGVPGQTAYCASKFAVRGFSEALRSELHSTGVGLTLVHPGGIRTNIATSAAIGPGVDPQSLQTMAARANLLLRMDPSKAAAHIVRALLQRKKRVLVGVDAHALTLLQRLFPVAYSRVFPRT